MDNQAAFSESLKETAGLIRTRLEMERFFVRDFFTGRIGAPAVAADKQAQVNRIIEQVAACQKCPLHATRKNPVFGEGNLDAQLMFVGEAPGHDEDLAGRPFVGPAGQLLTKIIEAMGLARRDVYISNVLRCRPPANRNPLPEEVVCCRPYLEALIRIIHPKVICCLGKFAAQVLLNETAAISKLRGRFFDAQGVKIMATYHPAYLLRNPDDKKLVWEDMKQVLRFLKNP